MPLRDMLILTTPMDRLAQARETGLTLGCQAYRVGRGPHLFRSGGQVPPRGALMVMDCQGFDGQGEPGPLCQETVRECAARGLRGVLCDFEGRPVPLLQRALGQLEEVLSGRNLPLYVPESYGPSTKKAGVLISSALSGGSLEQRLAEAGERLGGMERVVLAVERVAEDFFLPSPSGSGRVLSREELRRCMDERCPSVFFDRNLCAHYFTYMAKDSGAHFVLFDDAGSIRKKLLVAARLGVKRAVASWPDIDDLLPRLLEE